MKLNTDSFNIKSDKNTKQYKKINTRERSELKHVELLLYCQVTSLCAERRPSAVYVTLPAFAAELPAAGTRHQRTQLSLDIHCTQGDLQQTGGPPLLLSIDGTD